MRRREALKTLAAAAVLPQAAKKLGTRRAAPAEAPKDDWKPLVFDEHQNRTVTLLAELIIPRTDTPGATDAQVNRYIDRMLADSPPSARREFLGGLAWLNGYSNDKYGAPFVDLKQDQQVETLKVISSHPGPGLRFFRLMKRYTADGYYTSKVGLEQELKWGSNPATEPPGCPHGDH